MSNTKSEPTLDKATAEASDLDNTVAFPSVTISENAAPTSDTEAATTADESSAPDVKAPTPEEKRQAIQGYLEAIQFERAIYASRFQALIGEAIFGQEADPKAAKVLLAQFREYAAASKDMADALMIGDVQIGE